MAKLKGWKTSVDTAAAFFQTVYEWEQKHGRTLTAEERGQILDCIAQKLPYEHIEAMLEGKKVLVIDSKEKTDD